MGLLDSFTKTIMPKNDDTKDAWNRVGYARLGNSHFKDALFAFESALEIDPKSFDGVSQKEVVEGLNSSDVPKRLIVSETNFRNGTKGMRRSCAIWEERWKVIVNNQQTMRNRQIKFPRFPFTRPFQLENLRVTT